MPITQQGGPAQALGAMTGTGMPGGGFIGATPPPDEQMQGGVPGILQGGQPTPEMGSPMPPPQASPSPSPYLGGAYQGGPTGAWEGVRQMVAEGMTASGLPVPPQLESPETWALEFGRFIKEFVGGGQHGGHSRGMEEPRPAGGMEPPMGGEPPVGGEFTRIADDLMRGGAE